MIEPIGHGGMGTVWLAERADGMVKRRVALKLPHAVWGDAFTERLDRERDILAALEHPHIARLYDAGVDAQAALPSKQVHPSSGTACPARSRHRQTAWP